MECASLHSARPKHSFLVVWSDQRLIPLEKVGNLDGFANCRRLNANANRLTIYVPLRLLVSRHVTDKFPDEWIDEICEADPPIDDLDLEDDDRVPKVPRRARRRLTPHARSWRGGNRRTPSTISRRRSVYAMLTRTSSSNPSSSSFTTPTCSPSSQRKSAPTKFVLPIVATSGRTALLGYRHQPGGACGVRSNVRPLLRVR